MSGFVIGVELGELLWDKFGMLGELQIPADFDDFSPYELWCKVNWQPFSLKLRVALTCTAALARHRQALRKMSAVLIQAFHRTGTLSALTLNDGNDTWLYLLAVLADEHPGRWSLPGKLVPSERETFVRALSHAEKSGMALAWGKPWLAEYFPRQDRRTYYGVDEDGDRQRTIAMAASMSGAILASGSVPLFIQFLDITSSSNRINTAYRLMHRPNFWQKAPYPIVSYIIRWILQHLDDEAFDISRCRSDALSNPDKRVLRFLDECFADGTIKCADSDI